MTAETKKNADKPKAANPKAANPKASNPKASNRKAAKYTGKMLVVEQVRSAIRRPRDQKETLIGLGLGKMHRRREVPDTPASRGMISKVSHLVQVIKD